MNEETRKTIGHEIAELRTAAEFTQTGEYASVLPESGEEQNNVAKRDLKHAQTLAEWQNKDNADLLVAVDQNLAEIAKESEARLARIREQVQGGMDEKLFEDERAAAEKSQQSALAGRNRLDDIAGRQEALSGTDFRQEVYKAADEMRSANEHLELNGAYQAIREEKGVTAEIAAIEVNRLEQEIARTDRKSMQEMIDGAGDYVEKVEAGNEARKTLRSDNLEDFAKGMKADVEEHYKAEEARIMADPSHTETDLAVLATKRRNTIAQIDGMDRKLGGQMAYINDKLREAVAEGTLTAEQGFEKRADALALASQYRGHADEFAAKFLQHNVPDMAPVDLKDLTVGTELDTSGRIFVSIKDGEVTLKSGHKDHVGGVEVKVEGGVARRIIENGLNLDGMDKVSVAVDTSVARDDHVIALSGTHGTDVRVSATNGGKFTKGGLVYSSGEHALMARAAGSVVSVGGDDPDVSAAATIASYRHELNGRAKFAGELAELERKSHEVAAIEAGTQHIADRLPPHVRAAVAGMSGASYQVADMGNTAPTDVPGPSAPGSGRDPSKTNHSI